MNGGRLWNRTKTILAALVCVLAGLAMLVAAANKASATPSDEAFVHAEVNEARAGRMAPLRNDPRLVEVAREQAQRMRDQGRIFHNPNNGRDVEAHAGATSTFATR